VSITQGRTLLEEPTVDATTQVLDETTKEVAVELAQASPRIHRYPAHDPSSTT
jgi:hypothetical protein